MCGRVTLELDLQLLKEILQTSYNVTHMSIDNYTPKYNIAPSQPLLSIINDGHNNRCGFLEWGLIPLLGSLSNTTKRLINARSETLDIKPSFLPSFVNKRCIIMVSSFYEWHRQSPQKTPYRITIKQQPLMPIAGIWSSHNKTDGSTLYTCAVITTQANDTIKNIHHRMPVILESNQINEWLNPSIKDTKHLKKLLVPYASSSLQMTPVSTLVNNSRIDTIECIQPL